MEKHSIVTFQGFTEGSNFSLCSWPRARAPNYLPSAVDENMILVYTKAELLDSSRLLRKCLWTVTRPACVRRAPYLENRLPKRRATRIKKLNWA